MSVVGSINQSKSCLARGSLPRGFTVGGYHRSLPWELTMGVYCGNLLWEFTMGGTGSNKINNH